MSHKGKDTTWLPKPALGANFGQDGPSAAKREAARLRALDREHTRYACSTCPYTRTARCVWECAHPRNVRT